MLQKHEVLRRAVIFDDDPVPRRVGGHEELILRHLAIADQRRGFGCVLAELAEALHQDRAVRGGILDAHGLPGEDR